MPQTILIDVRKLTDNFDIIHDRLGVGSIVVVNGDRKMILLKPEALANFKYKEAPTKVVQRKVRASKKPRIKKSNEQEARENKAPVAS